MPNPFKIGDKVHVYDVGCGYDGTETYTVQAVSEVCVTIACHSTADYVQFHYQQCRKVKTKQKREMWAVYISDQSLYPYIVVHTEAEARTGATSTSTPGIVRRFVERKIT